MRIKELIIRPTIYERGLTEYLNFLKKLSVKLMLYVTSRTVNNSNLTVIVDFCFPSGQFFIHSLNNSNS